MEAILAVAVGLALSAACGFRVFVPFLGMGLAIRAGHFTPIESMAWIGSDAALIGFAVATVAEVAAYYVPWLDNFLDSIATPAAVIGGAMLATAGTNGLSPFLKWSLAAIGAGTAGAVQLGSVSLRIGSLTTSGGLANPVVSTGEVAAASMVTLMALLLPILAITALLGVSGFGIYFWRRKRIKPSPEAPAPEAPVPV